MVLIPYERILDESQVAWFIKTAIFKHWVWLPKHSCTLIHSRQVFEIPAELAAKKGLI